MTSWKRPLIAAITLVCTTVVLAPLPVATAVPSAPPTSTSTSEDAASREGAPARAVAQETGTVASAGGVTLSTSVVPEAPTYASDAYSDPWDFSNGEDLSVIPGYQTSGISGQTYRGGRYEFTASAGATLGLAGTVGGALANGRDTALQPLDAARWTRLSFRMWSSVSGVGQIFWFSCAQAQVSCSGATSFTLKAGWQYYDVPLVNTTGTPAAWSGRITGIRLSPTATAAGSFSLDDVRLYAPSAASAVRVDRGGDTRPAELLVDLDQVSGNGNESVVGSGLPGSFVFDASRLAAGRWFLATRAGGVTTYASTSLDVDAAPLPVVLDPDLAGGADYAQVVRGDRWDYAQASDAGPSANLAQLHVDGRVLTGRNGAPLINDPQVGVPLAGPIDGSRFHRLTMKLENDGPFGLADAPGGGMVARLIWQVAGAGPNDYQDLNDIVVLPGQNTITVDLATDPAWAVTDEGTPRRIGWAGHAITSLRFDPNEDPSGRTWRIDDISIAEDDRGAGAFDIRFADRAWSPGTKAELWVDSDHVGFDGTRIAQGLAVTSGVNTFRWDATGFPAGRYWVHLRLTDGVSSRAAYSGGPVRMTPPSVPPPIGSLDAATAVEGGAAVRGWALDPTKAGGTTSVHVYADGRPAAVVEATGNRPDIGSAYPAFGSAHGYDTRIALSPGQHQVCVYAFRGPSGPNPSLGCRAVVVPSGNPVGRLDSLVRAPGGFRIRGWALDPSTAASITTHVYADGAFVGAPTANTARADIGRAFPGYGDAHGINAVVPARGAGVNVVCLYGLDAVAPGGPATLGCRSVDVTVDPFGRLDTVTRTSAGRLSLRGWAIDPDTASPAQVHVYVDGRPASVVSAGEARSDISGAFPEYAAGGHGWSVDAAAAPGPRRVCAYAVNVAGPGASVLLGCGTA